MGAGCSSPLRKFAGKKSKSSNRDSISIENNDNLDQITIAARLQQEKDGNKSTNNEPSQTESKAKLNLDNEITIQSEAAEDHPSSASYYGENRLQLDDTSKLDHPNQHNADSNLGSQSSGKYMSSANAAARIMGLSGFAPLDRHLLVSPALSPAPSVCQSPVPNNSFIGSSVSLDFNDLNEAFRTLTFGPSESHSCNTKIKLTERHQSELLNLYGHQLVRNKDDLSNHITVVFIANNNDTSKQDLEQTKASNASSNDIIENLVAKLTSNLKTICDEHSFDLRFLNLSQDHLGQNLFVNNLQDVSMNIFQEEYKCNSEKFVVIFLSNGIGSIGTNSSDIGLSVNDSSIKQNDKRSLPTKINAQLMESLLTSEQLDSRVIELLKLWYIRVEGHYYLKPVYLVFPDLLEGSKDAFTNAWRSWLCDSQEIIAALGPLCDSDTDLAIKIGLKHPSNLFIDFLIKEIPLHKRTLLIRNYPQSNSGVAGQQLPAASSVIISKGSLSELARQLPDPNKLTLKRSLTEQEFSKTLVDWIGENFCKYIESFAENRIVHGKFAPPFIERNLFTELTKQRHELEHNLENITESYEAKCREFYASQIQPILRKFIDNSMNSELASTTTDLSTASQSSTVGQHSDSANHLHLISGPSGCGKTTLFAQLVKHTAQEMAHKTHIIYRFCGSTLDSLTPGRLLRSICEQFCQIQGENTAAASYIYSARKDIMNSLNKILRQQNCLIFLDGISSLEYQSESILDWLCELDPNGRLRIFASLETDSSLYKKALESYTDATFISLDNPTVSEWAQMLAHTARSRRLSCSMNLYDELKNLEINDRDKSDSITYRDISNTLSMCGIRQLNNERTFPELAQSKTRRQSLTISDYKSIIHTILKHFTYLLAPSQLCSFFLIISSSRNGMNENDIIDVMNLLISHLNQKYPDSRHMRFSEAILSYLKLQFKPWLRRIICDRTTKLTLQNDFLSKANNYYIKDKYPKLINEVREIMLDYYSKPWTQTRQRSSSKGSEISFKENISRDESMCYDTQVSETMNLLILTNPTKAKDYLMHRDHFYFQFIFRSYPEEFIEDYERLKSIPSRKASQTSEELQTLVNYIKQSIFPLRYDGTQIYSQIYCRSFDSSKSSNKSRSKKFNEILNQPSCPPVRSLLPISGPSIDSFIKTRIGLNAPPTSTTSSTSIVSTQSTAVGQQKSVMSQTNNAQKSSYGQPNQSHQQQLAASQKIFTIKDNHRHVVVIYPTKNIISVWDIFEEKAVRTINNVDQPRDLRMIDQKRAVVLCNRELRVYDLDSGQQMTKLKGVMNQKMPYFEVFGQDYVVALARNRMYVNMLNLNTGEMETTFKAGEDRFLNSLLVSANGGICVCGDETQKPFPLLVWDLKARKLMHDLRMDRHEFITRMSAISEDGHFVVSVCKQLGNGNTDVSSTSSSSTPPTSANLGHKPAVTPNFIVIYDLSSGTLFKKWKPGLDTCAVAISFSANRSGKVMNTIVDSSILVWDLATGSKRHTLVGHTSPADILTAQNNRLFSMDSTCHDQSLRIWDIDEGYCLAVFSPDAPVNCCQLSTRADALVCGFAYETRLSTLLLCKDETVNDIVKRNKRRKSSKGSYIFDDLPNDRKTSS